MIFRVFSLFQEHFSKPKTYNFFRLKNSREIKLEADIDLPVALEQVDFRLIIASFLLHSTSNSI